MRNGFLETNTEPGKAALVEMFKIFEENAYPEDLDTIRTMSVLDLATVIAHALMTVVAYAANNTPYDDTHPRVRAARAAHTLALSELARRAEVK